MYVYLERKDGSDGEISCLIKTTTGSTMGGKKEAVDGKDFEVINERYTFKHGETEARIRVIMPDCVVETKKDEHENGGESEEGPDTVTFALEISEPTVGVKLSKKNICFIDIIAEEKQDERALHER